MLSRVKEVVRHSTLLYEPIRWWRGRAQEREYILLREYYYRRLPSSTGKTKVTLVESIPKRSLRDVRLLVAVAHDWEHRTMTPVLQKDFDTVVFDYGKYVDVAQPGKVLAWRNDLQRDLLEAFEQAHSAKPIDLVLAYGSYTQFEPSTLQRIRVSGAPVALMWLDDKHTFVPNSKIKYPNGQKPLIGAADVHLTNSIECVGWYRAEGAAAYYFPEGCNPELGSNLDVDKIYDVTFVGKRYGARGKFIEQLRRFGIRIECFGPGWPNGPVLDEDMPSIFKQSWINLGFGGVRYSDNITCLKGRDFDVPATGSVYLTTYDPELAEMFHIGREILCYRNAVDAVEQIRYGLAHKEELLDIGRAARQRCIQQHTWTHRLSGLLEWLEIL